MPFQDEEPNSQPTQFDDKKATNAGYLLNFKEKHFLQKWVKLKRNTFCNIKPGNLRFEHAGTLKHSYVKYDPMLPTTGRLHHVGFLLVNHRQPSDASTTLSVDRALAAAKVVSKNTPSYSIPFYNMYIPIIIWLLIKNILPWDKTYVASPTLCPGTDSKTQTKSLTRSPRSLALKAFLGRKILKNKQPPSTIIKILKNLASTHVFWGKIDGPVPYTY